MLNTVIKAVTNLAALMLLSVILDLILPSDTMRKYARFVAGLLVMLAMIKPLLSFVSTGVYSTSVMRVEAAVAYSKAMSGQTKAEAEKILLRIAEEQAGRAAKNCGMANPIADVKIQDGQMWVRISESGQTGDVIAVLADSGRLEQIKEYVASVLDIPAKNITIERRGAFD